MNTSVVISSNNYMLSNVFEEKYFVDFLVAVVKNKQLHGDTQKQPQICYPLHPHTCWLLMSYITSVNVNTFW